VGQPEACSRRGTLDLRQRAEAVGVDSRGDLDHGRELFGAGAVGDFGSVEQGLASLGLGIVASRYDQGGVADGPCEQLPGDGEAPGDRDLGAVQDHGVRKPEPRPDEAPKRRAARRARRAT
jgi:hypothetical protein